MDNQQTEQLIKEEARAAYNNEELVLNPYMSGSWAYYIYINELLELAEKDIKS